MRHPWQKQRRELYVKCVHFFHGFKNSQCVFPILSAILLILSVFQPRSQAYSLSVHANTLHQVNLMADTNDYLVLPYTSATVDGRNGAPVTWRISHFARVFSYIPIGARFLLSTVSKRHPFNRNNMKPNSSQRASALSALARWPQLCDKIRQVHSRSL